jgi:hypothetical protein
MKAFNRMFAAFAAATAVLAAADAHAQIFRAYLSADGSDANPCTVPAPCRLLPAALAAVADGGEVWMLDSANYNTGPVVITKSVTIVAIPGVLGSLVALGGSIITIDTAGVRVALRNVALRPFPGHEANNGIEIYGGSALLLERCTISGLGFGVYLGGAVQATVRDSRFADNSYGVYATAAASARITGSRFTGHTGTAIQGSGVSAGQISIAVARSVVSANRVGISAIAQNSGTNVRLVITDTLLESNDQLAVEVFSGIGAIADGAVSRSRFTRNAQQSISSSGPGSRVVVSGNTITLTNTGLFQFNNAVMEVLGNNTLRGNTFDTAGTMTPVATQ